MNQKVIIRSDRAGVFYGELASQEPLGDKLLVKMDNVRRLNYWDGAFTLTSLATDGTTRPANCQFSKRAPTMTIAGIIEIIPCTEIGITSIEGVKEWKR